MYIGRFLVAAPGIAGYRVSSRSFPNRTVTDRGDRLTVVPTDDAEPTDNPYVSYNAVRVVSPSNDTHETDTRDTDTGDDTADDTNGDTASNDTNADSVPTTTPRAGASRAVIGNGSHVDPAAEKLARGYPPRDALVESLHALDYEKDDYDTPRIAAVVDRDAAHVGIVRRDALLVRRVTEPHLVATYERNEPTPYAFDADTAADAARAVHTADFEHAVCAAGVRVADAVTTAIHDGD